MHKETDPAILLVAGIMILALEVMIIRRGALIGKFNGVTRADTPLAFWFIVIVNGLLGVSGLVGGIMRLFAHP